jgi:hypothetical protein
MWAGERTGRWKFFISHCQSSTEAAPGRKQFETYFKFGFVRNPWDRIVSLYERKEVGQLRDKMTFEQFVDWIQYSSATCIHSAPHRYQLDWFVDHNGNVLADFIGKFERPRGGLGFCREETWDHRSIAPPASQSSGATLHRILRRTDA